MNSIPLRWSWAKLDDVSHVTGGLTQNAKREALALRFPYLRVANVYANELRLEQISEIGVAEAEVRRALLEPGDLLVVEGNGSLDQIGRVAVWNGAISPCLHQNHLIKVRFARPGMSYFGLYWLLSSAGRQQITQVASSTSGLHTLSISKVQALEMPVAPLEEQDRIVAAIDSYLTRLDDAVATLQRVERNLERYRASVLKAAVEGRLVPTEASLAKQEGRDYEPASVLLERILTERRRRWAESGKRGKYQEPTPADTSKLPELPEGWCWSTVDTVGDVLLGRQRAPQYLTGQHSKPYLRVANVKDDHLALEDVEEMDFDETHFEKYRLLPGDILVSEGQSPHLVGQSAIYRGGIENLCFQKTLHRFRAYSFGPSTEFAQLVFRAHVKAGVFKELASITTNIAHLTLEKFQESRFPLPPAAEQSRIVEHCSLLMSEIDATEQSVRQQLARCQRLRQSILKWAFEGKLADQDPADEPASELLARIQAERVSTAPARAARPPNSSAKKRRTA